MSRDGSVRSSFFRKTEEDFREEILDLKRQLARVKEESKLLKVKLRKSEENAARKEKIICTMIDPLKTHLSAKCMRDCSRISQDKGSSVKHDVHCQGLCSRSDKHDFKTHMDCYSRIGQQRRNWKKKCDSKVTTFMHCLSPSEYESSKLDALKCNQYGSCERISSDGSNEIMGRDTFQKMKGRDKNTLSNNKTSRKRKEKNALKKKIPKKQTEDNYDTFGGVSEHMSPSLQCNLKEKKRKCRIGVEMKCGIKESPIASINCEQCRLRSLQKETTAAANCSIENLLFERKTLLSLWNGLSTDKQIEIPHVSATLSQGDNCGCSKCGIYLIKEGDEQQGHNVADDTYRHMYDETDTHRSLKRESIFWVDVKKKEPKEEKVYIKDVDLYQETELDDNKVVDDYFESGEAEGSHGFRCSACNTAVKHCDGIMEKMMDSLAITEQSVPQHREESNVVNISAGDDNREMMCKESTSSLEAKTLKIHADSVKKHLHWNGFNCHRTPSIGNILIQSENMLDRKSNLSIHGEFSVNEESMMHD